MCISPNHVWIERGPKWEQVPVPCRACWRCRENRINDYVARCMAEAAYSETTCVINMTYAPRDDLADKMITPKHFQLFMKLLRRAGHKVRYLVAGEYGGEKGRAHFHAILFFQHLEPLHGVDGRRRINVGTLAEPLMVSPMQPRYIDDYPSFADQSYAPFCREIPQERMVHIREWPHGHITVDWSMTEKSVRYVCKYLTKDDKNNAWFSLSKKPALGARFFAAKAAKARELSVLPSSFDYMPPGGNRERPYLMTGASRRDYLNAITQDETRRSRMSEWVQKSFDKQAKQRRRANAAAYGKNCPLGAFYHWVQRRKDETDRYEVSKALRRAEYSAKLDWWLEMGHDLVYRGGKWIRDDGSKVVRWDEWRARQAGFENVEAFKASETYGEQQRNALEARARANQRGPGYVQSIAGLRRSGIGARFFDVSKAEQAEAERSAARETAEYRQREARKAEARGAEIAGHPNAR